MVPRISAYEREFDETKYMSFLIKDNELLEKYNEMWEKVSDYIKKGFNSEPVDDESPLAPFYFVIGRHVTV